MHDNLSNRRNVIIAILVVIMIIYLVRLFYLQILSPKYMEYADSNAFYNNVLYPARGTIYDRSGKLLVYNKPTYDVMIVVKEMKELDTLDFCNTIGIDTVRFNKLCADMKDKRKNPGYTSYTPQLFMSQLDIKTNALLQEKLYKFPGIYVRSRAERQYAYSNMGLILGYIAEVDENTLKADTYYSRGDYAGKAGLELSHEKDLRGDKGVQVLLRDARGRIKGSYENGSHDKAPISGKDLRLGIDIDLQAYGEQLMHNKIGSIVMIEPSTGEVLAMVSSPGYDPALLTGNDFGKNYLALEDDPYKPLFNRAVAGTYPPGSTFKPTQALIFLQEGIITSETRYFCSGGYPPLHGRPACHAHYSPLTLQSAISTSCNSFFCYGFYNMLHNRDKYANTGEALDVWRDYMVAMGYGYPLGVDMPSEKRGFIPNGDYYTSVFKTDRWNAHNIISIAIGQGEILATPLQIANLAATIGNRGYYYIPHLVKEIKGGELDAKYRTIHPTGISKEYYDLVADGMADAVSMGTCRRVNLEPSVKVCGKTGTAENPHGLSHSLFMGFAPKDNPKVAISVVVENGGFGATNAVPIARLMLERYFNGEIPESDKWLEESMMNKAILPQSYMQGK